jgi:hypothetical protein
MRSSLRTITNINIDGQAIDCVSQDYGLSFRVNCDSLSWVVAHYYDYEYGTMQGFYYPAYGTMQAKHNGETFTGNMWPVGAVSSPFQLGHDYTTIIYIFQNYPESGEHHLNTGPGKYDVLLGSGRIQQDSSGNEAYIDPDITSYMSPQMYDGRLIGGCMIRIDGTLYLIKSYNRSTGKITLGDSTTAADITLNLSQGQLYYLVSNYIQCDPFTWYSRSDPVITFSTAAYDTADGIKLAGTYTQAQEVAMQSYQFACNGEQGSKSFSYDFNDKFPLPFQWKNIDISCIASSQENKSVSISDQLLKPTSLDTTTMTLSAVEIPDERKVTLTLSSIPVSGRVFIWRKDTGSDAVLIKQISTSSSSLTTTDYTTGTGKSYTYYAVMYYSSTLYTASAGLTITAKCAKITKITENGSAYHRETFTVSSSIVFDIAAETGDITGNVGASAVITEAGQPAAIFTNDDYEQGSFTTYLDKLGSISGPINNGIKRIESTRDLFSQNALFLLQDNAGNVRIVTITDVSRSSDYMSGLTRLTLSWTEVRKLSECLIE